MQILSLPDSKRASLLSLFGNNASGYKASEYHDRSRKQKSIFSSIKLRIIDWGLGEFYLP